MAGAQVVIVASAVEKQRLGYQAISLTNFASNTLEPQIAAGSKMETGSALYEFTALESITGWAGIAPSSQAYIKTTVGGGGLTITVSWTITVPTWDTAKQGWYIGTDRVIGGCYKDAGGNYSKKWIYDANDQGGSIKLYGDGTANINAAKIDLTLNSGSQAIGATSSWTVPAGIYVMSFTPSGMVHLYLSIDGHDCADQWGGGAIISDGTNVVLKNSTANIATVYYRKLA